MNVTPTELRQNLFQLLDRVIATGEPLLVRRGEHTLRVAVAGPESEDLSCPPLRADLIVGDPDDLNHIDWSAEWTAGRDL